MRFRGLQQFASQVFNKKLQQLIFDDHGLLSNWHQLDTLHQMQEIGNRVAEVGPFPFSKSRFLSIKNGWTQPKEHPFFVPRVVKSQEIS